MMTIVWIRMVVPGSWVCREPRVRSRKVRGDGGVVIPVQYIGMIPIRFDEPPCISSSNPGEIAVRSRGSKELLLSTTNPKASEPVQHTTLQSG